VKGFKLTNIENLIGALKAGWVKRIKNNWKIILLKTKQELYLKQFGAKFVKL